MQPVNIFTYHQQPSISSPLGSLKGYFYILYHGKVYLTPNGKGTFETIDEVRELCKRLNSRGESEN